MTFAQAETSAGPGTTFEAVLTLQESSSVEFAYFGDFDDDGTFHGPV
jgi:hypothetical protein